MHEIDFTHDRNRKSWVESANDSRTDFPIQNLPLGVFRRDGETRIGVAIGNQILDLKGCAEYRLLPSSLGEYVTAAVLNPLMRSSMAVRRHLRHTVSNLLDANTDANKNELQRCLHFHDQVEMQLPCEIGDYSDFYASIFHATHVGAMFRPDNPLLPNYKHIPIGYHGRGSSIVVSGTAVRRPCGQKSPAEDGGRPSRGPSAQLDYELEVGFFVGPGNSLGQIIPIAEAEDNIFGLCLVNDWSARDLQRWEYQPLGPFLAKSFATTISPWIVTPEALAPFRCPEFQRVDGDPLPLEYLNHERNTKWGGVDLTLEVYLTSTEMRKRSLPPEKLSGTNFSNMYWTMSQMLTHHASNGCNLRPGDLLASGTVSGPERHERGCLLELTWNGDAAHPLPGTDRTPIQLPTGEQRKFLEDGDEVILRGYCANSRYRRIGFGECIGQILPASN